MSFKLLVVLALQCFVQESFQHAIGYQSPPIIPTIPTIPEIPVGIPLPPCKQQGVIVEPIPTWPISYPEVPVAPLPVPSWPISYPEVPVAPLPVVPSWPISYPEIPAVPLPVPTWPVPVPEIPVGLPLPPCQSSSPIYVDPIYPSPYPSYPYGYGKW